MENACGGCGKADHADGAKFCAACGRNLRETGIYLLGSRMSVRQHSGGLDLVRHLVDGGSIERAVIDGHLEVLEHLDVDGDDFWRVQLEEEIVTNFSGLSSRLRASGRVLDRRNVDDVLSAVLRGCRTSGKSHATFGVYAEDGELRLCTDPVPVKEEQRKAWEVVKPCFATRSRRRRSGATWRSSGSGIPMRSSRPRASASWARLPSSCGRIESSSRTSSPGLRRPISARA